MKKILNYFKYFIKSYDYLKIINSPFKGLTLDIYWGEIVKGVPYFLPRRVVHKKFVPVKYFGFDSITLGWKSKYDEYRFEWPPIYSFIIFGKQLCITIKPNINSGEDIVLVEDIYWEAWLNYRYRTDKTKSKLERLKELKEKHSCTYIMYNRNTKTKIDYYTIIIKDEYLNKV